jgi:hypothetical protein
MEILLELSLGLYGAFVCGDIMGIVHGDIYGRIRGDISGTCFGDVRGIVDGRITGHVRSVRGIVKGPQMPSSPAIAVAEPIVSESVQYAAVCIPVSANGNEGVHEQFDLKCIAQVYSVTNQVSAPPCSDLFK